MRKCSNSGYCATVEPLELLSRFADELLDPDKRTCDVLQKNGKLCPNLVKNGLETCDIQTYINYIKEIAANIDSRGESFAQII